MSSMKLAKISLGQLHILSPKKDEANGGAIVEMRKHFVCQNQITNLLDLPLPKNATTFQSIKLSHFDSSVLYLLHRFQQKSLLVNVNLVIWSELTKAKVEGVLAQILPLIDSIQAIWLCNTYWVHEFPQMATTMLARARILKITSYQTIEWYCRWLYTPREDGAPRVLYIGYNLGERNAIQFIDHIKKDFSLAKLPITFFIHFRTCNFQWQEMCLENGQSKEKLVAKKTPANDAILVCRYPMKQDAVKGWIEAKEHQVLEHEFGDHLIFLDNRLIIN